MKEKHVREAWGEERVYSDVSVEIVQEGQGASRECRRCMRARDLGGETQPLRGGDEIPESNGRNRYLTARNEKRAKPQVIAELRLSRERAQPGHLTPPRKLLTNPLFLSPSKSGDLNMANTEVEEM